MSNKYEKFDNEFGLLPAKHENVNMSKQKNGGLRTGSKITASQLRDHFSDDKCAVEIITNCNGKKHLNEPPSDPSSPFPTHHHQARSTFKTFNEFDTGNLAKLSFGQRKWRFNFEQNWYRLLSISLILTYCILIIYDLFIESRHNYVPRTYEPSSFNFINYITLFMSFYFGIEVCFRIYASGYVIIFEHKKKQLNFIILYFTYITHLLTHLTVYIS